MCFLLATDEEDVHDLFSGAYLKLCDAVYNSGKTVGDREDMSKASME